MKSAKEKKTKTARLQACSFCRQVTAREVARPQVFERDKQLLIIEQVPTLVCSNCGETYFTGGTLDELERILAHPTELATLRAVPVAQYGHPAA